MQCVHVAIPRTMGKSPGQDHSRKAHEQPGQRARLLDRHGQFRGDLVREDSGSRTEVSTHRAGYLEHALEDELYSTVRTVLTDHRIRMAAVPHQAAWAIRP